MTSIQILRGDTIKAGDTKPVFRLKLMEDGTPFNLTGYDVTIAIRHANDDTVIVDGAATVEDETRGIVTYSWSSGETDTAGTYEFEIVADDGVDEITFPNRGTETVHIQERLT